MTTAAAVAAAVLFGLISLFQVALALGVPWGAAAYGGGRARADGTLPPRLRVASAVAALLLLFFAGVVLVRAEVLGTGNGGAPLAIATWVIVALMALNTLGNFTSPNPVERWGMGSVTAALVVLCALVAAG